MKFKDLKFKVKSSEVESHIKFLTDIESCKAGKKLKQLISKGNLEELFLIVNMIGLIIFDKMACSEKTMDALKYKRKFIYKNMLKKSLLKEMKRNEDLCKSFLKKLGKAVPLSVACYLSE